MTKRGYLNEKDLIQQVKNITLDTIDYDLGIIAVKCEK